MFESAFDTTFAMTAPANVLALVKLRWVEASQDVLGEAVPPFEDFTQTVPADANFACLTVEWKRTYGIKNEEGQLIYSSSEFLIAIADEDPDRDALLKKLFKRSRVVDSIIRTAATWGSGDRAALLDGFPPEVQGLVDVDIPEWVPGRNVLTGQRNIRAVGGTLVFSQTEA
jgi:hypothetical protein